MSGLFGKAMRDAAFSVTMSTDGGRSFNNRDNDNSGNRQDSRPPRGRGYNNNRGNRGNRGRGRSQRNRSNWRGRGRGGRGAPHDATPRSYLADDDDESMGDTEEDGQSHRSRYTPYGARPPSRRGYRQDDNRRGSSNLAGRLGTRQNSDNSEWYKVVVNKAKSHDREWLIKRLQNASDEAFQPVEYHYMGDSLVFFVEGSRPADALKRVSHSITIKDGSKLIITVRPSQRPFQSHRGGRLGGGGGGGDKSQWTAENEQVVKECLSTRYNLQTKSMDLSDLFHDEVLKANGVHGALSKYPLAIEIVKLIGENCPQVETLDLSNNRLYSLDHFKELPTHAPGLKHLKLGNAMLKSIEELDKLKGLKEVVSLELKGNSFCDRFDGKASSYVSAVRSRFPKVINLDGEELPPAIGFDLQTTTALPPAKESYIADPQIKDLVLKFLEQYYKIYDSGDRQPLLEAYHDQAIFSMCVNTFSNSKDKGPRASLGDYMRNSRNMKKVLEPDRRANCIKHNRLSVVAMLDDLPTTKHDLSSFTVDVVLALSTCLTFSVRGLFMEDGKTLRSFTRVFVAVPAAGGKALSIINDQLHIRHASSTQIQTLQKKSSSTSLDAGPGTSVPLIAPTPSVTPVFGEPAGATTSPAVMATPSLQSSPIPNITPQQQQMVLQFSAQSRMNTEWSFKCLAENNWSYEKSAEVFTTLQSKGSIPADAFIKT